MKGLKIVLWVCAIACLPGFLVLVMPWPMIAGMFELYGLGAPTVGPLEAYMFRLTGAMLGLVGVFFLLLALRPMQHRPMLLLAGIGLLAFSLITLVGGIHYRFPLRVFLPDTLFCGITGALIVVFRAKTLRNTDK